MKREVSIWLHFGARDENTNVVSGGEVGQRRRPIFRKRKQLELFVWDETRTKIQFYVD